MAKTGTEDAVIRRRSQVLGPTAQSRALAEAAARLTARRQRDLLPVRITTARLALRPPIRGDVPDIVRLLENDKIHAMLTRLPKPYTRADGIAFVEIFAQSANERPYAITLADQFIGVVGFTYMPDKTPELGYWLGEPYWDKGYMSEAVKGLLDAAFATHHYPLIRSRALASNPASLRVLEKTGFKRVREGADAADALEGKPTVFLEREQPRWM